QDEEVEVPAHEHAQAQAALLAARERADGLERVLARKAEGAERVPRLLGRAAAVVDERVERRTLWLGELHVLGQVGELHRRATAHPARVRLLLAHDELHERRLAAAVFAYDGHALPARDLQREARKELPPVKALGEPVHGQDLVAPELPLLEGGVELALRLRLFGLAELLYALFHGEGPLVQLVVAHEGPEVQLRRRGF